MTLRERQPNWRTLLINDLLDSGQQIPNKYKDDDVIRTSLPFQRALKKAQKSKAPSLELIKLEEKYPHHLAAHEIANGNTMDRYFIEALILARVPTRDIAIKTGFGKKTVELFEALYFDVRRWLRKEVFVMSTILGPIFDYSCVDYHDHLWKAVGYLCGKDALESIWKLGQTSKEGSDKVANLLRSKLLSEAATASFSRRPGKSNAGYILDSYLSAGHLDVAKESSEADKKHKGTQDDYLSEIHGTILDNMKLGLKRRTDEKPSQVERTSINQGGDPKTDGFSRPVAFGGTEDKESIDGKD